MHLHIRARLNELKSLVLSHHAVHQIDIRGEEVSATRGYLRLRLILGNQETMEVFVYLVEQDGIVRLMNYNLHWQYEDETLIQRWDTAPPHPELTSFPHHTHKGTGKVEATEAHDWESFMALLERVISSVPNSDS